MRACVSSVLCEVHSANYTEPNSESTGGRGDDIRLEILQKFVLSGECSAIHSRFVRVVVTRAAGGQVLFCGIFRLRIVQLQRVCLFV